ncbi:MAG: D-alanyl-D-alanine carboxypeptidase family protein, partial [Cytophagales bacterium]|nr:D-alanyl-D-alanine carboxypeptidase family protein [Cytophagales bacterium]
MTRRDFLIGLGISPILVSQVLALDNEPLVKELMGFSQGNLTGNGYLLRKEAAIAFEVMSKAAKQEGISLTAVSSYRSFDQQAAIWNRKYTKYESQGYAGLEIIKRITEYSSLPGTSRHHWGTELDLIDGAKKIPADPLHEK